EQIGAEHLANADLLGALDSADRRETKEPETGQEDRQRRKHRKDIGGPLFGGIKPIVVVVEKTIIERTGRDILFPCGLQLLQRPLQIPSLDPDKHMLDKAGVGK